MRAAVILLIFSVAQALISCYSENRVQAGDVIINMDSLILAQSKSGVAVNKTVSLGDDAGSGTNEISTGWEEELAAFGRIGIMNLPVWRNSYQTSTGPDPNSNLMLKRIYATDSAAPVRELRIAFFPKNGKVIRLGATLAESGMFYSREEILNMEFDPATGRLEKYSVSGIQQLAWFEPDKYRINAFVRYPENP